MQIFLQSKQGMQSLSVRKLVLYSSLFVLAPALVLAFFLGAQFAPLSVGDMAGGNVLIDPLQKALGDQKSRLVALEEESQSGLNGLAVKLGQLQAQMLRLNALGQRMAKRAGLDEKEFDFSSSPALGGISPVVGGELQSQGAIQAAINELFVQLQEKEQELTVLGLYVSGKSAQKEFKPAGRPIKKGWLSSYFGRRTDPFTGRKAWHHGVDFAGREGSDVVAMASGVITWASDRHNYGHMVEIDHGKGYVTRYGHNKELLVQVGDTVRQGEAIAKMGSTGRSTGPHVHLEVLRKGQKVDPVKFIRASR